MNLTTDQYIEGLEKTANELPGVLLDWENLDEDLRDEYQDQLFWMIQNVEQALNNAGKRRAEINSRCITALSKIMEAF